MKVNIVSAWNWLTNTIDTLNLSNSEQLILFHLVKYLNRNYWKPLPIDAKSLAKNIGRDPRTIKDALKKLINAGLITESKEGYYIGIKGADPIKRNSSTSAATNKNPIPIRTAAEPRTVGEGEQATNMGELLRKAELGN